MSRPEHTVVVKEGEMEIKGDERLFHRWEGLKARAELLKQIFQNDIIVDASVVMHWNDDVNQLRRDIEELHKDSLVHIFQK